MTIDREKWPPPSADMRAHVVRIGERVEPESYESVDGDDATLVGYEVALQDAERAVAVSVGREEARESYMRATNERAIRAEAKLAEAEAEAEVARLSKLVNTPETEDFSRGVVLEAAHQVERWGEPHDRSKSAENWFWLVGYLAGKALRAAIEGDRAKALHHTISSAAALLNWHGAIARDDSGAGVGQDEDLRPSEGAVSA